jgi:hypothetical protein
MILHNTHYATIPDKLQQYQRFCVARLNMFVDSLSGFQKSAKGGAAAGTPEVFRGARVPVLTPTP